MFRRGLARTASTGVSIGSGFPGLVASGMYPADVQVAVGPTGVVEMTNATVGVYTRDGFRLSSFPMTDILGASNFLTDPQIAWDPTSQRWIAAGMDVAADATNIAISDSSDPTGSWEAYSWTFGSSACPDQPRLGFSSAVVVVATELFSGSCHQSAASPLGGVMLVVDKQAVLDGATSPATSQYGPSPDYENYVPVQMLAPSQSDYVASTDPGISSSVHVLLSQGVPPADTLSEQDALLVAPLQNPGLEGSERGGGLIDAGDDRINDATWLNGTLYLVADDRCTYQGDPYLETCARVMEISTSASQPSLIGENDIGTASEDAYYAAIRPDSHGNAIIVFDYSGPHDWPSIAVTAALGPIDGEQGGTFAQPLILAQGTNPSIERWGDYSGAAIDPNNPDVIWTAGQVADSLGDTSRSAPEEWATHLDEVSAVSQLAPLPNEVYPGTMYRGRTRQGEKIQLRPSGGGGHLYNVWATLRMRCRGGASSTVGFQLPSEQRNKISGQGSFSATVRYGSDRYAHGYWFLIQGRFRNSYSVTGILRGDERTRHFGLCASRGTRFSAHT